MPVVPAGRQDRQHRWPVCLSLHCVCLIHRELQVDKPHHQPVTSHGLDSGFGLCCWIFFLVCCLGFYGSISPLASPFPCATHVCPHSLLSGQPHAYVRSTQTCNHTTSELVIMLFVRRQESFHFQLASSYGPVKIMRHLSLAYNVLQVVSLAGVSS